jgi:hypothetical protein
MTPSQLQRAGAALYGDLWKRSFERDFHISNRGLRRLLKDQAMIGDELAARIMAALTLRAVLVDNLMREIG